MPRNVVRDAKRVVKKSAVPEYSTYTLKQLDRALWSNFTAKCTKDGRKVKYVMLKMIRAYADGEFRIEA